MELKTMTKETWQIEDLKFTLTVEEGDFILDIKPLPYHIKDQLFPEYLEGIANAIRRVMQKGI